MAGIAFPTSKDTERARLERLLAEAENYTEWCKIASQLDEAVGSFFRTRNSTFISPPKVVNTYPRSPTMVIVILHVRKLVLVFSIFSVGSSASNWSSRTLLRKTFLEFRFRFRTVSRR
jgi:hypothetical protein